MVMYAERQWGSDGSDVSAADLQLIHQNVYPDPELNQHEADRLRILQSVVAEALTPHSTVRFDTADPDRVLVRESTIFGKIPVAYSLSRVIDQIVACYPPQAPPAQKSHQIT